MSSFSFNTKTAEHPLYRSTVNAACGYCQRYTTPSEGIVRRSVFYMNIMKSSVTVRWNWLLAGVVVGFVAWIAVGGAGFLFLRTVWSDYALAEPTKSYTLLMLFSRLAVGGVCTITAGAVSAVVAKSSRAAWWLGSVLLVISAPIHLPIHLWSGLTVWADYPTWYHFAYLVPLMPLTIFGGGWSPHLHPTRSGGSRWWKNVKFSLC